MKSSTVTAIRGLTLAAVFVSPFTGLRVFGLNAADILLSAGAVAVVLAVSLGRGRAMLPTWSLLPPFGVALLYGLQSILPTSQAAAGPVYASFTVGDSAFEGQTSPLLFAVRLAIGITCLAVLASFYVETAPVTHTHRAANRLIGAYVAGAATSAMVATLQFAGLISLGALTYHVETSRATGLAFHPNSLAQSLVTAIPGLYFLSRGAPMRRTLALLLAACLITVGLFAADSRAGLIMAPIAYLVPRLLMGANRDTAKHYLLRVLILAAVVLLFVQYGNPIADTRLLAPQGASNQSNQGRLEFLRFGWTQFTSNPITGVGLEQGDGVMVPLALASSGGILLLLLYYGWLLPALKSSTPGTPRSSRGFAVACGIVLVLYGVFNNDISERFVFVMAICASAVLRSDAAVISRKNHTSPGVVSTGSTSGPGERLPFATS